MSRPIRMIPTVVPIALACIGMLARGEADDAKPSNEDIAAAYSSDGERSYSAPAGLIRVLQEHPPTVGNEEDPQGFTSPVAVYPVLSQVSRPPIELEPLGTPNTNLNDVGTGIRPEDVTVGRLPPAQPLPSGETRIGQWGLQSKPWVPGGFCHQPLYFEDPMLERHGHVCLPHFQPVLSGLRFYGTVPLLPYLATLRHPLEDVHTLGAYRPGTSAPVLRYRAHYDPIALRNQLLSTAGFAVAVP